MKRIAVVFVLAILIPSVLLAVMAVRSLRDQELVVNSQRALFYQSACDSMAGDINLFMDDVRVFHGRLVEELVERETFENVTEDFSRFIQDNWSQASMGAVVSDTGEVISPSPADGVEAASFLMENGDFLTNRRVVEVFEAPGLLNDQLKVVEEKKPETSAGSSPWKKKAASSQSAAVEEPAVEPFPAPTQRKVSAEEDKVLGYRFEKRAASTGEERETQADSEIAETAAAPAHVSRGASAPSRMLTRNVMPMQQERIRAPAPESVQQSNVESMMEDNYSSAKWSAIRSGDLTRGQEEGAVGRIIDGELHVLLWKKVAALPGYTFWTELNMDTIAEDLSGLFDKSEWSNRREEVSLALLDTGGNLVGQTVSGFSTDWTKPFVASEVGQILPRWEVAAYLVNPELLDRSAQIARFTIWLVILILLGAVAAGTVLILRSVNYEMRLASRKTDFVSNVSHELKTPLTSIRMFSELLENSRDLDAEKAAKYSGVISRESARLTRLINRLLDFSRLDRGEMKLNPEEIDLPTFLRETVETHRSPIEEAGFQLDLEIQEDREARVAGDQDALSQVVLNLISNAEKYAASGKEILVTMDFPSEDTVRFSVHDRGNGIPRNVQRRIFEKFYRAGDSIDSGIEGSGIGLALCRQIIELHGGTIQYSKREKGGSTFSVEIPLVKKQ